MQSPAIDPNRPSPARIYDFWIGGVHNFAADRAVADRAAELLPELPAICRQNRAFLGRAARYAVCRGVRQFLDLGAGIPAPGDVREVVRSIRPDARFGLVDREPTAVLHATAITRDDPDAVAIQYDLLQSGAILADPELRKVINFAEPVCVLLGAVLHFLPDSPQLTAALLNYREAAAPGSVLAVSHATASIDPEMLDRIADLYRRTGTALIMRDSAALATLFEGWELVEPGIVYGPEWQPDPGTSPMADAASSVTLAGVGVRR
ncbi:SAM-dependent methyltransferase [Actinoplanes sp. NPDC049599]|uniref:SAM-dependent methyltransferase n=1 Tax=Actinoplanes sp. NPDC049599 TaxID=3363903 RepID=UPI0037A58B7F